MHGMNLMTVLLMARVLICFRSAGASSTLPDCDPNFIKLTVTSSASGLSIEEIVVITVKLAGDANGDGVVNILDKVMVRNAFGSTGAATGRRQLRQRG